MTHNTPERNSLIQNSVVKLRSGTEPSTCPPLLTFLMFKETVEKGDLHSEDIHIINEPHSPQSKCNGLGGETHWRELSGIIYMTHPLVGPEGNDIWDICETLHNYILHHVYETLF